MLHYSRITFSLICVAIFAIWKVQCQMAPAAFVSNTERAVIANLTEVVHYVIGPMARPSQDMIDYAMATRANPSSTQEMLMYLEMMKTVARETPDVIRKFTKIITLPNGSKITQTDETTLNVNLTRRAMEFLDRNNNTHLFRGPNQAAVSSSSNAVSVNRVTPLNTGPPVASSPNSFNTLQANTLQGTQNNAQSNVLSQSMEGVVSNQNNGLPPANDGSISFLDLMTNGLGFPTQTTHLPFW